MLNFPEWSDLARVSSTMMRSWQEEIELRMKYRRYFDGSIFEEHVPVEVELDGEEAPLLYPVGINLVKMLCLAQADSLFGEWEDQIVTLEARQDQKADDDIRRAIALSNQILATSNANSLLWEVGLDRLVYGGGALKVSPELHKPGHIRWSLVPLDSFYPIWSPDDPDVLLETYTLTMMTAEQARIAWGIDSPSSEIIYRVEHWTPFAYENTVDGRKIDAFSGINPWGFVPFAYIPNYRSNSWWGDPLTEDIIRPQDELNMRVADIGDSLNYNAHPTRWGKNLPKGFNANNFPIGANAMWDLGRSIGNGAEAEVGILEAKNPVPQGAFEHIKFLYDWGRTSSFSPPIAFGEDNGGGQRSGTTLEIRMWPLIKSLRRSRAYMGAGISRALWMSAKILQQKKFADIPSRALKVLEEGLIQPRFAPILPRDHQAAVDEVVKLSSLNPPRVSMETSQKILGRGPGEIERIREDLDDSDFGEFFEKPKSNEVMEAQAGKDAVQPGKKKEEAA